MKVENRKRVEAPPAIVWGVAENIERWPEWTPTVTSAKRLDDGPFDVGSVALLKQPGLPETEWCVVALRQGEGFTWETKVRGIRMVATHELEAAGSGTTSVIRIEMSGILCALLGPLLRASARRALERENTGLKAACEALAR